MLGSIGRGPGRTEFPNKSHKLYTCKIKMMYTRDPCFGHLYIGTTFLDLHSSSTL